jgi:hypothetical protein
MTVYVHPVNGYREEVRFAPLWALLLGPVYFAYKGCWGVAVSGAAWRDLGAGDAASGISTSRRRLRRVRPSHRVAG